MLSRFLKKKAYNIPKKTAKQFAYVCTDYMYYKYERINSSLSQNGNQFSILR